MNAVVRFPIQPRMVAPAKIARRLGITVPVFVEKRTMLEREGFPRPDPVLGTYCLEAVDRWIDARHGLGSLADPLSAQAEMMAAVRSRPWAK